MSANGYAHALIETAVNSENTSTALSTVPFYAPAMEVPWEVPPITEDRSDELRGTFEALPLDVVGFEPTTLTLNNRLYANFVGLPIFLTLGFPVTTAGNGVITDPDGNTIPAGATRHVWDSAVTPAAVRSAQIQLAYPDAVPTAIFWKMKGMTCEQLDISPNDRGFWSFAAALKGTYTTPISDPSLTPTYDAVSIKPFVAGHHSIPTWLASTGTPVGISYSLNQPSEAAYSFASASKSPDIWDKTDPPKLTAELTFRSADVDDYNAMIAGTQWTVKTKWVSDQFITGSYPYKLFIEGNAMYSQLVVDSLKHQIRHQQTAQVSFGKAAAASGFKITLVNGVSSYSSVS